MSLVRLSDVHETHPLQPVVPKMKGMERADRAVAALQITSEIAGFRGRVLPHAAGTTTADAPVEETEETAE